VSLSDGVLLTAALVAAVGVLVAAVVRSYKVMHRIDQALGVDQKGRTIAERLAAIEHQVWPNSGQSMFDRVRELERSQIEIRAELRTVRDLLSELVERR